MSSLFRVKYLSWQHRVKTINVKAFTENQAAITVSKSSDVKAVLDIKQIPDDED